MSQLHKKFTDSQVKELIERYLKKEIERNYIQEILGIKKRRFFSLVSKYRANPSEFSIQYQRTTKTRNIDIQIEKNIIKELSFEKKLIQDDNVPLKSYHHSGVVVSKTNKRKNINKRCLYLLSLIEPRNMGSI